MNFKDKLNLDIFLKISDVAKNIHYKVYLIGGIVRDMILDRNNNDIDIVTDGDSEYLCKNIVSKLGGNIKISIFRNFGTAMFKYNDITFEFVTARKESYTKNSRKPIVSKGNIIDDQLRRDFTINTLAISLNYYDYGTLIDRFNGVKDLFNKLIRTPLNPNITYSDDPLRMMRAIRFATQLNFTIDKESFLSIKNNCNRIRIVSYERLNMELNKIILCSRPSYGFILMFKTGLLNYIIPELVKLKGIDILNGKGHKDNFYHTLEVLDNISIKTNNLWLRWAALLHDIGKYMVKRFDSKLGWTFHSHEYVGSKMIYNIFKRLKLPLGNNLKYVKKIVMLSSRPISIIDSNVTDSAIRRLIYDAGNYFDDLMLLCRADVTTKNKERYNIIMSNFNLVEKKVIDFKEREKLNNFKYPINGNDIINTFNIPPSKKIGILKEKIKEAILDGEIENNYKDALNFIKRIINN